MAFKDKDYPAACFCEVNDLIYKTGNKKPCDPGFPLIYY